jgi:hypothetical protein
MKLHIASSLCLLTAGVSAFGRANQFVGRSSRLSAKTTSDEVPTEADVVIIGSGLAGLSCGALLSHCKKNGTK